MADLFLSYSHSEAEIAVATRQTLLSQGLTVWMDDATGGVDDIEAVGIPVGERHWNVILDAIAACPTFIVLDSPAWRESSYCLNELGRAVDLGHRVALISDGPEQWPYHDRVPQGVLSCLPHDVPHLGTLLVPDQDLAWAAVRLRIDRGSRPLRLFGLLGALDSWPPAKIVLEAAPGLRPSSPVIGPDLLERARVASDRRDAQQRARRRGLIGLVLVLSLLASASVIAGVGAAQSKVAAEQAAKVSRAENLANASLTTASTSEALSMAKLAAALHKSPGTRDALAIATAQAARVVSVPITADAYVSAATTTSGLWVAAASSSAIVTLNTITGAQRRAGATLAGRMAFSGDGSRVAALEGSSGSVAGVELFDPETGEVTRLIDSTVVDVVAGEGSTVWLAHGDGQVEQLDVVSLERRTRVPAHGSRVAAFDVTKTKITVLTVDAILTRFDIATGLLDWSTDLREASFPAADPMLSASDVVQSFIPLGQSRTPAGTNRGDLVRDCGSAINLALGWRTALLVTHHTLSVDASGKPIAPPSATQYPFGGACLSDGSAWVGGMLTTTSVTIPEGRWAPYGTTRASDRFSNVVVGTGWATAPAVIVHTEGWLQIVGAPVLTRDVGPSDQVIAATGGVHVRRAGSIWEVPYATGATSKIADADSLDVMETPCGTVSLTASSLTVVAGGSTGLAIPLTDDLSLLGASSAGCRFMFLKGHAIQVTDLLTGKSIEVPITLAAGESLYGAICSDTEVVFSTTHARVVRVDLSGTQLSQYQGSTYGPQPLAYGPESSILVFDPDGYVRRLGSTMQVMGQAYLGYGGNGLRSSQDGSTALALDTGGSGWELDGSTLAIRQRLPGAWDYRSTIDRAGRYAVNGSTGSTATRLVVAPLIGPQ
jgi:hypothetical protein